MATDRLALESEAREGASKSACLAIAQRGISGTGACTPPTNPDVADTSAWVGPGALTGAGTGFGGKDEGAALGKWDWKRVGTGWLRWSHDQSQWRVAGGWGVRVAGLPGK